VARLNEDMRLQPAMREITRPAILYVKAALLLLLGITSAGLLLVQSPLLSTVVFLAISIWAFARAYYFAFYVIERYVDRSFRFSGLWSCVVYMCNRRADVQHEGTHARRSPSRGC
jgi:hypothetical protein